MRLARVGDRPGLLVDDGIVDIARAGGGRFGGDPMDPIPVPTGTVDWEVECAGYC